MNMRVEIFLGQLAESGRLLNGEQQAIAEVLRLSELYGHGNLMAWIATSWAENLKEKHGMSEKAAIHAVSNRTPYRIPRLKP
jgi:hypothetical protein